MEEGEQKFNINLCLEVEKHPCLYDNTVDDHSNRQVVIKTWEDVGKRLRFPAEVCKKRWSNLRTVFVRRISNQKSGSGTKKAYYLNRYMQFLMPHIKLPVTVATKKTPYVTSESYHHEDPEQIQSPETKYSEVNVDEDEWEDKVSGEECLDENTIRKQQVINTSSQRSNQIVNIKTETDQPFVEYIHAKRQKISFYPENARRCFLLSLLPEVNDLPESQFRIFKRRVLGLLDELNVPHSPLNVGCPTEWEIDSPDPLPSTSFCEET